MSTRLPAEGCRFYVDDDGRPYRRRVDPPEGLFEALAGLGIHGAARRVRGRPEIDAGGAHSAATASLGQSPMTRSSTRAAA